MKREGREDGAGPGASGSAPETGGFAVRGAIEGFYGRPYTFAEREQLVEFLGARGLNAYVYAPKNDPLHRERWRELYDRAEVASFAALARRAAAAGIELLYAIAPGLSYDAGDASEFSRLEAKLAQLVDAGVAGIALLFDDIAADSSAVDPVLQAELVARTAASVARRRPDAAFWFIGNYYAGTAAELASGQGTFSTLYARRAHEYFDEYNRCVPAHLPILWTGPGVFSATLTAEEAAAFRHLAGRPVIVWDNFPVNDALPGRLFLGPYCGRDPRLPESMLGIVANLMAQPVAGRVAMATVADYLRDPAGYDAERSLAAALATCSAPGGRAASPGAGAGAGALARCAAHFRGHPVLAPQSEAIELAQLTRGAFGAPPTLSAGDRGASGGAVALDASVLGRARPGEGPGKESERAALARHLAETAASAAALVEAESGAEALDPSLRAEIAPWIAKLGALARAALAGIEAIDGRRGAGEYRELRHAAEAGVERVACTRLPGGLAPFVAGIGDDAGVDRFAELFAAIDRALEAQGVASTAVT